MSLIISTIFLLCMSLNEAFIPSVYESVTPRKKKSRLNAAPTSFQEGTVTVSRTCNESSDDSEEITTHHEMHYKIRNRMNMSSQKAAPLLVLHGGPGVPSDYLLPICNVVPYRCIVFYDQLGCGKSPGPENKSLYSIESSLNDLELLIHKLGMRRFHIYGQSFGGILAFEYLKRIAEGRNEHEVPECLSAVLSSSPTDVEQIPAHAKNLVGGLLEDDPEEDTVMERFRKLYQVRTEEMPQELVDAYAHAGTIWRGTDSIPTWKAKKPLEDATRMPSAMVMHGEYDFVSEEFVQWKDHFNHPFVRIKVLKGCSHHGLLERPEMYGELLESFFTEYD